MAISLSSISTDPQIAPPRVVLYGTQGIGKTTFGASAPNPILLPIEDGIGKLSVAHFPLLKSFQDVLDAITALYTEQHDYQTVVVDSADWLEPLVWRHTCEQSPDKWADIEAPGYGKGYVAADEHWQTFLAGLDALRAHKSMAVIILAHADVRQFHAPDSDPYDRYTIKLHKRASGLIREWPDALLFANYKTFTTKTDVGFNKSITRGVGDGQRVMYTEERPAYYAKNRYQLAHELPLDWSAFVDGIAA